MIFAGGKKDPRVTHLGIFIRPVQFDLSKYGELYSIGYSNFETVVHLVHTNIALNGFSCAIHMRLILGNKILLFFLFTLYLSYMRYCLMLALEIVEIASG